MIKPIIFNTEMVRAILTGTKTQTRRIVKGIEGLNVYRAEPSEDSYESLAQWDFFHGWADGTGVYDAIESVKAPYAVGDVLWVRETWGTHYDGIHDDLQFCYRADGIDLKSECLPGESNRWYQSNHMPKEAARIFLRVKSLRVERLQDMSEDDAFSPFARFAELLDKTIRRDDLRQYGYHANPWVWVIEFERCDKPEGWCRK